MTTILGRGFLSTNTSNMELPAHRNYLVKPMFPSVGSRRRKYDLASCLAGSDSAWNLPGAALPLYLESEV